MDPDRDLQLRFVNRQERLFNNIYNQLKIANEKGILSSENLEEYRSHYNDIVCYEAKKAYTAYKLKYMKKRDHIEDLFSAEIWKGKRICKSMRFILVLMMKRLSAQLQWEYVIHVSIGNCLSVGRRLWRWRRKLDLATIAIV